MQASLIRNKYKQILEEPESENSDDEWQIAYSQMARHRKKRILTEASPNKNYQENSQPQQSILAVKQKLAQCLANCKDHTKEIERMRKQELLFEEERTQWQENNLNLKRLIEQGSTALTANKQKAALLEQEIQTLTAKVQQLTLDRQLQIKQSEYYRSELAAVKQELDRQEKDFKLNQKQFRQFDKIKKQNEYLKSDLQRLAILIEDSLRYGKISSELMKKHFLGKPHRQFDYWYPDQLVNEVELFLKKHQIGYGNKQFTTNLIKFVARVNEKSIKQCESKAKAKCHSISKAKENSLSVKKPSWAVIQNLSSKKHSCHVSSLREEALKSNISSFWKPTDSRVLGETNHNYCQISIKSSCWEIITEFKSIVFELLLQKEVKRKKIKKLIDSMLGEVMEAFELSETAIPQKKDNFASLKLQIADITAPLKTIK